jgi:CTP synthase
MILHHLQLNNKKPDMTARETLKGHIYASTTELRIAMVGKYVELEDAYYSLNESLKVAGLYHHRKVKLVFIEAEECTKENIADRLVGMA